MCNTIFRSIPCDEFDNGAVLLMSDLSIDCHSPSHQRHVALAVVGVVLFVVGLPLAFLRMLMKHREDRKHPVYMALAWVYRDEAFFTEPLICLQKVCQ